MNTQPTAMPFESERRAAVSSVRADTSTAARKRLKKPAIS